MHRVSTIKVLAFETETFAHMFVPPMRHVTQTSARACTQATHEGGRSKVVLNVGRCPVALRNAATPCKVAREWSLTAADRRDATSQRPLNGPIFKAVLEQGEFYDWKIQIFGLYMCSSSAFLLQNTQYVSRIWKFWHPLHKGTMYPNVAPSGEFRIFLQS